MEVASGQLPPRQFKPKGSTNAEHKRRAAALAAQSQEMRANRIDDMRRAAMDALLFDEGDDDAEVEIEEEVEGDDAMQGSEQKEGNGKRIRRLRRLNRTLFFARQLQLPDWMVSVPEDLGASWLLQVRPEGDRFLFLSDSGKVQVRRKNGQLYERFVDSRLPHGLTVLDVVCIDVPDSNLPPGEPDAEDDDMGKRPQASRGRRARPCGNKTYAIMDVLCWGDQDLVNASAECRSFWLQSRFSELPEKPPRRARPLRLIPMVATTAETFQQACNMDFGYAKDSLLFLHRDGYYALFEPVTPLVLAWRDRHISRFVVDTPDPTGEQLPEKQPMVLELRGSGYLRTADHLIVAKLSEAQLEHAMRLTHNRVNVLIRCQVSSVDAHARRLTNLEVLAFVPSRSRIAADSWGRIVFQHSHRSGQTASICAQTLLQRLL
jgi:snurportin-1